MKQNDRPIAEILFPLVRAKVLEALFTKPPRQRYVRELERMTNLAWHTIKDELRKLTAIGILRSWSNGYHKFYSANQSHPLFRHLQAIIEKNLNLPTTKVSALDRPPSRSKKRSKRTPIRMRQDRQPNWGLFEARPKI